ncbi:MAG: polyprenyl synthetase family protein [Aquiluna sp.]|nr:polyprenyl synthetase family protein [Aquiluna sp.]MCF8545524.1 polyprenyl synthetase family protein [Aquiluna sp.]
MKISLPSQLRLITDRSLISDLENRMVEVEKRIKQATSHTDAIVNEMSSHLANAGGKRIRPVLTLLTAKLGDCDAPHVLDAAVVMELTHIATLYHDDVMDEAPKRRGVDTAHTVWGNNIAILTGDLLFARASNIVSGLGEEALLLQAQVFEQLVLGQLHESIGPQEGEEELDHYIQVLKDKTGSLIALSARLGALLSGADAKYQEPLQHFGEQIGVAFQLVDDIIDIQSTKEQSGKVSGTDLLAGVPTLPVLLLKKHKDAESQRLLDLIENQMSTETLPEILKQLRVHKVMAEATEATNKWADSAISAISVLPDGSVKTALVAFAKAVVDRKG